ncbi:MAG: DNA internalization-related competence protein ComEC/Rec2 [Acetatifactor sp.]|nr:DNA internalization-related competence protein ComEC/Rec2 [Acetatifactor sp.]
MKRPLFAVAVAVVAVVWAGLAAGWYDDPPPEWTDRLNVEQNAPGQYTSEQSASWYVTGQVCRKENDKIWLQSVIINDSIPYEEKLICELTDGGTGISLGSISLGSISLGSRVTVSGIFAPFSVAANPGEFDTAAYYRSLGAGGRLRKVSVLRQSEECWKVKEALYQAKLYLKERLYRVFPEREATVMCALLLGEKGDTDSDLKELYKRNGILHILSISSLHITIIGMSLYRLLRRTGLPIVPSAVAGAVVLVLYGMMTGFSVSACRAIGMYLIRMFGEICGRTYDMLTALGILAAAMTLANPHYLQNAGFLLSFSAVMGIGAVYPALVPKEYPVHPKFYGENPLLLLWKSLLRKLKYAVLANLSITLATLPVQLWFYYEVPVWGTALNLLVLPLLMPALITGFLSLVPGLGGLGALDRLVLWWYEAACRFFDKMPIGVWNPGRPEVWQIVVYYVVLVCALILSKVAREIARSDRTGQISGFALMLVRAVCKGKDKAAVCWITGALQGVILAVAILVLAIRPGAQNRVIFLDVGQGDCCLVQTESGVNYLFDCGSSSRSKVGQYVLLPALKYYGIHKLDGIFLSHPDTDHMNGILELLELAEDNHLTVGQLILPAVEEAARIKEFGEILAAVEAMHQSRDGGVRVAWLGAGDRWDCGDVRFLCLNPRKGCSAAGENAYSECIYGDFGSFSLLLTGDVEGEGEKALVAELQSREINSVTMLKAAHHGSRNSTSSEFLKQLHSQAVVISCGQNNRYGHPHEELLKRLEEAGSHVFRTDQGGAVILWTDGESVEAGYYIQEK